MDCLKFIEKFAKHKLYCVYIGINLVTYNDPIEKSCSQLLVYESVVHIFLHYATYAHANYMHLVNFISWNFLVL